MSESYKPLTRPVDNIRKRIIWHGGKSLWEMENDPKLVRFNLEAFLLGGKVIILQHWPDGGAELYGPVDDSNKIDPILEYIEKLAKS